MRQGAPLQTGTKQPSMRERHSRGGLRWPVVSKASPLSALCYCGLDSRRAAGMCNNRMACISVPGAPRAVDFLGLLRSNLSATHPGSCMLMP